jgi:hypothetical protein
MFLFDHLLMLLFESTKSLAVTVELASALSYQCLELPSFPLLLKELVLFLLIILIKIWIVSVKYLSLFQVCIWQFFQKLYLLVSLDIILKLFPTITSANLARFRMFLPIIHASSLIYLKRFTLIICIIIRVKWWMNLPSQMNLPFINRVKVLFRFL